MTITPIPSEGVLERELADLCGKVGYKESTKSLRLVPGLIDLLIAGGPGAPKNPLERRERRDALRAVLKEIATHEVKKQLGEQYETAALKVFRLDAKRPLSPEQHRHLSAIQDELTDYFGEAPTTRGFLKHHRPMLFKVIARALIARETAAREQANRGSSQEQPAEAQGAPPAARDADAKGARSLRPRARSAYGLLAGGLLGIALVVWAASGGLRGEEPIRKQIVDDIPRPGVVRELRKVHLQDAATPSYFVVVRHPPPKAKLPSWDELRVYDESDSDAELRFVVRPASLIGGAPTVAGFFGVPTGRMYQFALLGIHDVTDDGRAEIFGVFSDQISDVTRPLAIEWNSTTSEYEVVPLIPDRPSAPVYDTGQPGLSPAHWARRESRRALKTYVSPGDRPVALYGATKVALRHVQGFGWLFISGYAAATGSESIVYHSKSGHPVGKHGFAVTNRFSYGSSPKIALLTVEVAQLRDADGLIGPKPCQIFASKQIWSDLVVAKLTTNALEQDPLAPRRLDLADHAYCPP